jgi:hypothetical protein
MNGVAADVLSRAAARLLGTTTASFEVETALLPWPVEPEETVQDAGASAGDHARLLEAFVRTPDEVVNRSR